MFENPAEYAKSLRDEIAESAKRIQRTRAKVKAIGYGEVVISDEAARFTQKMLADERTYLIGLLDIWYKHVPSR